MRIIRRYPNRKLYDVQNSRYISLMGLRELMNNGETIRVESTTDGSDMTRVVLARLRLSEAEQAVRSIPESIVNQVGSGVDSLLKRLQHLETGLSAFGANLSSPVRKLESITKKLEQLQGSIEVLEARLERLENDEADR